MTKSIGCPEYEKLEQARRDAILALQALILRPSIDSATALSEAKVFRDSVMERARVHKRECLFCSNMKPVGKY
jgi:hypothetical protein